MSNKRLELIDVLREELNAAGLCFGVDRAGELTESVLRRVVTRMGGLHFYARTKVRSRDEVKAAVLREFDGTNCQQVARRYGISTRTVYRWISQARGKD
jgi:Mor family transcriptional regulator